tara:strand:+ start:1466 stop:1681 length:216 start_codon:yes stop_codon:yes gene_type:complete
MIDQSQKISNKELILFYKNFIKKNELTEKSYMVKRLKQLIEVESKKNNKYAVAAKRLTYQRMYRQRKRNEL